MFYANLEENNIYTKVTSRLTPIKKSKALKCRAVASQVKRHLLKTTVFHASHHREQHNAFKPETKVCVCLYICIYNMTKRPPPLLATVAWTVLA